MVLVTSLPVLSLTDTLMVLTLPLLPLPWFNHLGASSEIKLNKYILFLQLSEDLHFYLCKFIWRIY